MVGVQQLIVEVKKHCTVCNLCDMMIDRVGVELLVAEKVRPPWLPPQVPWCPDRAPGGARHTIPYDGHSARLGAPVVPAALWELPAAMAIPGLGREVNHPHPQSPSMAPLSVIGTEQQG